MARVRMQHNRNQIIVNLKSRGVTLHPEIRQPGFCHRIFILVIDQKHAARFCRHIGEKREAGGNCWEPDWDLPGRFTILIGSKIIFNKILLNIIDLTGDLCKPMCFRINCDHTDFPLKVFGLIGIKSE